MECNEIREKLADYASDDTSHALRDAIEAHLAHCYVCREELSQHEALLNACRTALRHPLPLDRWDELRAIMDLDVPRQFPGWRKLVRRRAVAAVLATAATLVLVVRTVFAPAPLTQSDEGLGEDALASAPISLAPDGLISVVAASREAAPLQRYKDTVSYYFHSLDLDAPKPSGPDAETTPSPQKAPDVTGPSISLLMTSHIYA
ncbi:MAG: zf-HC2 domain-containing protein [Candidatus Hydrogenedentes bacterium]|nr:zf-HC2 domain-containing protein [Candidatus Hydrogenedentota bacterium]